MTKPLAPPADDFVRRHVGPDDDELRHMLDTLGVDSLEELLDETLPAIDPRRHPRSAGGTQRTRRARRPAPPRRREQTAPLSLIGMGYYPTVTPGVIQRNVLENPAWYTAYTPYQPEISQGRLEALLNFQTTITELTGLGGRQLLVARRGDGRRRGDEHDATGGDVDVVAVLRPSRHPPADDRRAGHDGRVRSASNSSSATSTDLDDGCFGALFSYPTSTGADRRLARALRRRARTWRPRRRRHRPARLHAAHSPGRTRRRHRRRLRPALRRADGVRWSTRRVHQRPCRRRPGDARTDRRREHGHRRPAGTTSRPADPRAAHPPRERATSNICTAQVLLANIAGLYACWHGPDGLRSIAQRIHDDAASLAATLAAAGLAVRHDTCFDTVTVDGVDADAVLAAAAERGIDLRRVGADCRRCQRRRDDHRRRDRRRRCRLRGHRRQPPAPAHGFLPRDLTRTGEWMTQSVFHRLHTEHEMLRYLRRLADRDLALDRTMIPLGSCTMKLNATTEMASITWPEFADLHPFAPETTSAGHAADDRRTGVVAGGDHRLRRGQRPAQRREPGRARRPAGDRGLPPVTRRGRAYGLHDPVERPWDQRRQCRDGRHGRRGRRHRCRWQRRRRRPRGQARTASAIGSAR